MSPSWLEENISSDESDYRASQDIAPLSEVEVSLASDEMNLSTSPSQGRSSSENSSGRTPSRDDELSEKETCTPSPVNVDNQLVIHGADMTDSPNSDSKRTTHRRNKNNATIRRKKEEKTRDKNPSSLAPIRPCLDFPDEIGHRPFYPSSDIALRSGNYVRSQSVMRDDPDRDNPDKIFHVVDTGNHYPHRAVADKYFVTGEKNLFHYTVSLSVIEEHLKRKKTLSPEAYQLIPDNGPSTWVGRSSGSDFEARLTTLLGWFPSGWGIIAPNDTDRVKDYYEDSWIVYEEQFQKGVLRFPLHPFLSEMLVVLNLNLSQLGWNSFHFIAGFLFQMLRFGKEPTLRRFFQIFQIARCSNSQCMFRIQSNKHKKFIISKGEGKDWSSHYFRVRPTDEDNAAGRGLSHLNKKVTYGKRELTEAHDPFPPLTEAEIEEITSHPFPISKFLEKDELILRLIGWTTTRSVLPDLVDIHEVGLSWLCDPSAPSERVRLGISYQSYILRSSPNVASSTEMEKQSRLQTVRDFLNSSTAEEIIRKMTHSLRQTTFFKGLRQLEYQRQVSSTKMLRYTDHMKIGYDMFCQRYNYPDLLEDEFTDLLGESFRPFPNLDLEVEKIPPDPFPAEYGVPVKIFDREVIPEKRQRSDKSGGEGASGKRKHHSSGSKERKKKRKEDKRSARSSDNLSDK